MVGTLLISASFSLRVLGYARSLAASEGNASPALYVGLLVCGYVLLSRAISMPSTPLRTAAIGAGAMVPLAVADAFVLAIGRDTSGSGAVVSIDVATWVVAAVAMSAVTSHVIFGLRAEVAKIRQLGQYTLEQKIGEGGMGAVYRARHAFLRRPTAIKLLPPEKAGEDNIRRFEREVQLTASLSHPNTVAIFDYGRTSRGVFYCAMEYLDGINLDQLVRLEGPQPAGRVVRILQQVSGALAEAHGIGLIHRDVKPANIILCQRGGLPDVAKVVDFGLVKRIEVEPSDSTTAVTAANVLVGTPLYMAPEALKGEGTVDARSDLYALGAVAYFLLTGTPVFQARTVLEVFAHHLSTPPETPSVRLGRPIDPDLERLVLQCLAKSPGRPAARRPRVAAGLDAVIRERHLVDRRRRRLVGQISKNACARHVAAAGDRRHPHGGGRPRGPAGPARHAPVTRDGRDRAVRRGDSRLDRASGPSFVDHAAADDRRIDLQIEERAGRQAARIAGQHRDVAQLAHGDRALVPLFEARLRRPDRPHP